MSVYFVYLRRPGDMDDRRNDPFWEFGSFGKTGCHRRNLLHPKNCPIQDGDQLAFLQGGSGEVKVVGLTPPVKVAGTNTRIELRWDKKYRPVPFSVAPLLINNSGASTFPSVYSALRLGETNRTTFCGRAASRLRARSTEVSLDLAQEIIRWFSGQRLPKITIYLDAIEGADGKWHQHGLVQKWAIASERAKQYKNLEITETAQSERYPAIKPGPPKRRRCC